MKPKTAKLLFSAAAAILLAAIFAIPPAAAGLPFSDVEEESWYYEYVGYVYENGLFSGTSDTTFEHETLMTRAMFVQLMANFDGVDLKAYTETPFEDVEDGSWYESAVAWAAENKVVNGTSEVTFHPGDPITREQMCQLLSSYTAYAEITLTKTAEEKTFADAADISGWAKEAVSSCQTAEIVSGKDGNRFDPQGTASRAEAATLLTNFHRSYAASNLVPGLYDAAGGLIVSYKASGVDVMNGVRSVSISKTYPQTTKVVLPNSVTRIGTIAFFGCELTEIVIPNSVRELDWWVFSFSTKLTFITIPGSITEIGYQDFNNCTALAEIILSEGVGKIGFGAFSACSALTKVTLPDSLTEIGEQAFRECTGLTEITIPDGVTEIGTLTFERCTSLTEITLPGSLARIGAWAFAGCTALTEIKIPDGTKEIGGLAFQGAGLTEITIPVSVMKIGNTAFASCTELSDIHYSGTRAQWQAIDLGYDWNYNTSDALTVRCTDGDITY